MTGGEAPLKVTPLRGLRVHDLRDTYASLARKAGADLRLLQKTMGHASITVTAHVYADLYDDELDSLDDGARDRGWRIGPITGH